MLLVVVCCGVQQDIVVANIATTDMNFGVLVENIYIYPMFYDFIDVFIFLSGDVVCDVFDGGVFTLGDVVNIVF